MEGDQHVTQGINNALERCADRAPHSRNVCFSLSMPPTIPRRWWALPEVGSGPQIPLLTCFQQLVELQESTRLLVDLGAAGRSDHHYSDLKDILETWRLRTPNEWERLSVWSDVLVWRNQIYNIVINAFKNLQDMAPHLHQLGYRDKAWSVNRLGAMARKQGCAETCKNIINTMYGFNAMEVQEAFIKIKEQAKAFLIQPDQLAGGLNLLNSQNLEYFSAQHQAELFRLKAIFLQARKPLGFAGLVRLHTTDPFPAQEVGQMDEANKAFSVSMTLFTGFADGWLSWAEFCDAQYRTTRGAAWLESAVTCYLQVGSLTAVRCSSTCVDNI